MSQPSLIDYKEMVLQVLWDRNQVNRITCELRILLFIKAAETSSGSQNECLMPFPACFYDRRTKTKQSEELIQHLNSIPKLIDIKDDTALSPLTWELLYWIFTNPLEIQIISTDRAKYVEDLMAITNLKHIPVPDNKTVYLFKIIPSQPKEKFDTAKKEFGSFFDFHGSGLWNFHSIIHRGLISVLNKRSAYGFGTYLSTNLSVSQRYCSLTSIWPKSGFDKSNPSKSGANKSVVQCVAIVEVVNHPSLRKMNLEDKDGWSSTYHVVDQDEYMQLSHLIVFSMVSSFK